MSDVRVVAKFVPADEQRGKLAHWAYWFEWEEADGTPARQRYPAEVPLDVAEAIIAAGSSALRARVAELERDLAAEQERSEGWRDRAGAAAQSVAELESRASAAVEAHAHLLSRIAADGTLDAMERAAAAEQRVKRMEDAAIDHAIWDGEHSRERLIDAIGREKVEAALAALAVSDCRCGHDASQHYGDSEARGRPCRECGCLGMDSDEATAREPKP